MAYPGNVQKELTEYIHTLNENREELGRGNQNGFLMLIKLLFQIQQTNA